MNEGAQHQLTGIVPCACTSKDTGTVHNIMMSLADSDETVPLWPVDVRRNFDGTEHGWLVTYYVMPGQEISTDLQENPEWHPRCKDKTPVYNWVQDIAPAKCRLIGAKKAMRLNCVSGPGLKYVTPADKKKMIEEDGVRQGRFMLIGDKNFLKLHEPRMLYNALFATRCDQCRRAHNCDTKEDTDRVAENAVVTRIIKKEGVAENILCDSMEDRGWAADNGLLTRSFKEEDVVFPS